MTVEEKRGRLCDYCDSHKCHCDSGYDPRPKCIFCDGDSWCNHYNEYDCPEDVLDDALKQITDSLTPATTEDIINHPNHYNREGGMESIDEMVLVFGKEAVKNFCLCNVWKYRYRAADKNGTEDLEKSDWYMRKYKELCSNG